MSFAVRVKKNKIPVAPASPFALPAHQLDPRDLGQLTEDKERK